MDPAASSPSLRPGLLRRAAAGAWEVPAGFWFLARNPRLWPLADNVFPAFASYRRDAAKVHRVIPLVRLMPR